MSSTQSAQQNDPSMFANKVYNVSTSNEYDDEDSDDSDADFEIMGFRSSLTLLRNFGGMMTKLHIHYDDFSRRNRSKLEGTIAKYCHHSLVEITLDSFSKKVFDEIDEPFEKVLKVYCEGGYGGGLIRKFNQLFPNATTLELDGLIVKTKAGLRCIQQHFPSLTHLTVFNRDYVHFKDGQLQPFTNKSLKKAILLNPQLKSLKLNSVTDWDICAMDDIIQIDDDLLKFINMRLPQLDTLSFDLTDVELDADQVSSENIHFKNLRSLSAKFKDCLCIPPISSDQLEYLMLESTKSCVYEYSYKKLIELLYVNKGITKLELLGNWLQSFSVEEFEKLPSLSEIKTLSPKTVEGIVRVLENCKQLTKLSVSNVDKCILEELQLQFGAGNAESKWTMKSESPGWTVFVKKSEN